VRIGLTVHKKKRKKKATKKGLTQQRKERDRFLEVAKKGRGEKKKKRKWKTIEAAPLESGVRWPQTERVTPDECSTQNGKDKKKTKPPQCRATGT